MRLLLIEDNERLVELVRTGLTKAGFAVDAYRTAGDGRKRCCPRPMTP